VGMLEERRFTLYRISKALWYGYKYLRIRSNERRVRTLYLDGILLFKVISNVMFLYMATDYHYGFGLFDRQAFVRDICRRSDRLSRLTESVVITWSDHSIIVPGGEGPGIFMA